LPGIASRIRGFTCERELARILWREGFAVIRAPASGSRARRIFYPDIVAVKNKRILVFEVKLLKKYRPVCVESYKINRLVEFARRACGEAYVAVKIIREARWFFIPVEILKVTEKGFYCATREQLSRALGLEELLKTPISELLSK